MMIFKRSCTFKSIQTLTTQTTCADIFLVILLVDCVFVSTSGVDVKSLCRIGSNHGHIPHMIYHGKRHE